MDLPVIEEDKVSSINFRQPSLSDALSSEDDSAISSSYIGAPGSRTSSHSSISDVSTTHTISLSSLEHCMPRAYIRICFAYRTHTKEQLDDAITRLKSFVRKTIDAKPYLAGSVVNSKARDRSVGEVEISFCKEEFLEYTPLEVKTLVDPITQQVAKYDDLAREGFPPSKLRPEEVAILPTDVHEQEQAPIFKVQANIVCGGLIVSLYLHHCISDGKGFDLLATGDIMRDESAFQRYLDAGKFETPSLNERLRAFAQQKTAIRRQLSWPSPNQINTRDIRTKRLDDIPRPKNAPGRGCVIFISHQKISDLLKGMQTDSLNEDLTRQSVLMAVLWRYMTRARIPSVSQYSHVKTSKLLIPVDIRKRISPPLADVYFGAAVDSAKAEMNLNDLADSGTLELSQIARNIRAAIDEVDESYVRQAIKLALSQDRNIDVRDLQASNMDRVTGADMYITSWLKLRLYEAHMDMGLGEPEWVRKPWSRDPGSCIILPQRCEHPENYEVVVQMTEADMARLLQDPEFMEFVTRVID